MTTRWTPRLASDSAADRLAAQIAADLQVSRGMSRRGVLRMSGVSALALGGASVLASCGNRGHPADGRDLHEQDLSCDREGPRCSPTGRSTSTRRASG